MSAHTYMSAVIHARIRSLCPSLAIVLASLFLQHLQLLPTLLCVGRDVLGCASCQWVLVTLPPSQPVIGLHHLQLMPAVGQLCCLMVEMRLAAASWQS